MSDMYILWLGALGMVLLSLAALLPNLLKDSKPQPRSSDETLRTLYRTQLQELAREHGAGHLSPTELVAAQDELQARLLAELDRRSPRTRWQHTAWLPRISGLLLAVLLPVAAFALYVQVGNPQAAARLAQADTMDHGASNMQVQAMVQGLADRLQAQPGNLPGWVMLARSYETLERYADAAAAYQAAIDVAVAQDFALEDQARLWADRADALGSAQGGQLTGAAAEAIAKALALYPTQAKALALAGSAAVQVEHYALARQHWQVLQGQLEPGSDIALKVQDDLLQLELLLQSTQQSQ